MESPSAVGGRQTSTSPVSSQDSPVLTLQTAAICRVPHVSHPIMSCLLISLLSPRTGCFLENRSSHLSPPQRAEDPSAICCHTYLGMWCSAALFVLLLCTGTSVGRSDFTAWGQLCGQGFPIWSAHNCLEKQTLLLLSGTRAGT